ncbi:hypothetical protein TRFO_26254 [Tritrichomonas foetus]|uniref:Uncharacterized protein n=1 Tax=Tritrichomonas foetus TaxID=1144522 RepID=A0A1J4K8A6_9EUKA|nr:hypothetical protein TRFO_26254 [Tritrichomonas foetus]|eukprot:OHT05894.1 hypothetical protein TRFO_26254 [Tritrichomonas foetus]
MSRVSTAKPQSSLGYRSKATAQDVMSRPGTRQRFAKTQQPEVKPAQVHELKLQTQQIKQQTKVLRTQLKRTEFQISSQTNAINKTFEQSSEKPQTTTIHAYTIPNIKRNIEGAQNTLENLKVQIKQAENDDKTSTVEELEEELKITYCEYQRLAKALQDKKTEANHYDKQLTEAEYRASNPHITELKAAIRDIRSQNASLRDKANAYQIKIEKMKIEQAIVEHQKNKVPTRKTMDDLEVERAEQNQRMNELCNELNEEAEQHDKNVAELTEIIEEMKMKISNKLTGEEPENTKQNGEEETEL